MHPTQRKVVVITGASSGLGRAAALEFARRGASVVLAARRADALEETARACRGAGAQADVVVTDVTQEAEVLQLAKRALELHGQVDIWVNNAGVSVFGLLETTPFEPLRRVFETNVYGSIFGARAAVPIFRRQGYGVLINVGSILSKVGQPFVPSYVISKFATLGLTEALRAELADAPGIHVCTLLPYAMNTQHFESAANFIGRAPYALPPSVAPEDAARALVSLAYRPRRERYVPRIALLGIALHRLFPRTVERAVYAVVSNWHFGRVEPVRSQGNLWQPAREPAKVMGSRPQRLGLVRLALWFLLGGAAKRPQLSRK